MTYAALTPPDKNPKFDFFLMHGLTSIYFLPIYFKHISFEQAAILLRSHFSILTTFWVVAGRPQFHLEHLLEYSPLHEVNKENPWLTIIDGTISTTDEHQCKALRSLIWADAYLGPNNGLWLKAAQATIDHIEGVPKSAACQSWAFLKLGYEEGWVNEKARSMETFSRE